MSWASISREAKNVQKKFAVVPPRRREVKKTKFCQQYQGPGQGPAGIRPAKSDQIDPNPNNSVAQIGPNCPNMLRSRFWLQIQDLGVSVGAIGMVFRDLSARSRPDSKNSKKKLRFLPCLFIKGTPVANSYIPYKRLAPIWETCGQCRGGSSPTWGQSNAWALGPP